MKIKIDKADREYSKYLRKLRGYRCERCGKYYPDGKGLQVSHFHGRRKESVRFYEDNTDCLCFRCHQYFEENPMEYVEWKKGRMGKDSFDLLTLRANMIKKKDRNMELIKLKEKIKLLEEEN